MTAPAAARPASSSVYSTPAFWERLWRGSGINFVVFFVITCFIYGQLPGLHSPSSELVGFYDGNRTRILVATALSGLNILNLMWFAAALRTTLADAGQDGWGAAATAASAAFGALFLLLVTIGATLTSAIAGTGTAMLVSGLHDFGWALIVSSSFPRAMLIMSAAFGLWRAGLISPSLFAVGVGAVVLSVLGGTTWMGEGLWAPDGAFSRYVTPAIGLGWILIVTRVLLARSPSTRAGW